MIRREEYMIKLECQVMNNSRQGMVVLLKALEDFKIWEGKEVEEILSGIYLKSLKSFLEDKVEEGAENNSKLQLKGKT
jgi:hypothetical protein